MYLKKYNGVSTAIETPQSLAIMHNMLKGRCQIRASSLYHFLNLKRRDIETFQ